jgi:hypothetical protein
MLSVSVTVKIANPANRDSKNQMKVKQEQNCVSFKDQVIL